MKVLLGSTNAGKIKGTKQAFDCYYKKVQVEGLKVASGVADQPVNEDIYIGAKNRANAVMSYAISNSLQADFYCGIESGITNLLGKWVIINIACIIDKNGYESWGTSQAFPVPDRLVDEIIKTDLATVMTSLRKTNDHGKGVGGVNSLTHKKISRIMLTRDAFIMALTQFINEDWNDKQ